MFCSLRPQDYDDSINTYHFPSNKGLIRAANVHLYLLLNHETGMSSIRHSFHGSLLRMHHFKSLCPKFHSHRFSPLVL